MSKIILYGGQGNIKLQDLIKLSKTNMGKKIISKLRDTNYESFLYFKKMLKGEVPLSESHASMLGTFIYNLWKTQNIDLSEISYFSSHSAGIFNVLMASGSSSFDKILIFIEKRAELVGNLKRKEEMWFTVTTSIEKLRPIIKKLNDVEFAITTNPTTCVLAFSEEKKDELMEVIQTSGLEIRIKKLNLKVPYHTKFLNSLEEKYRQLVKELDIQQNDEFNYIYSLDNLEDEIINQLTNEFNWYGILEEIINKKLITYDLTSNGFIQKQIRGLYKQINDNKEKM